MGGTPRMGVAAMCGQPATAGASEGLTSVSSRPIILPSSSRRFSLPPVLSEAARCAARYVKFADQMAAEVAPGARASASEGLTLVSNRPVILPSPLLLSLPPGLSEAAQRAARCVRFADQVDTGVVPGAWSRLAHPGGIIISSDLAARLKSLVARKLHAGVGLTADQERAVRVGAATGLSQGSPVAAVGDCGEGAATGGDDVSPSVIPGVNEALSSPQAAWLRLGSAQPHLVDGSAGNAGPRLSLPTASLRRLEPELASILLGEALPVANIPPPTSWAEAPLAATAPPAPLTTAQLILQAMIARLHTFRREVARCLAAARDGRWQVARTLRPAPLYAAGVDCVLPAGRGWAWRFVTEDALWYPLRPSAWPLKPPETDLDIDAIVDYAEKFGFPDAEIISFIAHGYPGPELELMAVLGPPHVGALKEPAAFDKCAKKDRERGWVHHGYPLPPIWPKRADTMNIIMRNGKPRMTIDKTMQLVDGVASYNDSVDLESIPDIE